MKVEKLGDMILCVIEFQMVFFNFYDEWLKSILLYIVFLCLVFILCVLYVNLDKIKLILRFDKIVIMYEYYIWFLLMDEDWIKVEMQF